MNQPDFDRAFPRTPDCIHTAIELGLRKGQKKMKFRNRIIAMGSIAAALAIMLAAALAMNIDRSPQPDVLAQPPLNAAEEEITVFFMPDSEYYHAAGCRYLIQSRMQQVSEREALLLGLQPCEACIPQSCPGHEDAIEYIYYSQGGKYFHRQEECSGGAMPLKGEYSAVLAEYPGKEPCPICFPNDIWMCLHGKVIAMVSTPVLVSELVTEERTPEPTDAPQPEAEEYAPAVKKETSQSDADVVYTEYGASLTTYHRLKDCAGREFPREISVMQANREKLQPCEACYFGFVCYNENGTYYHSDPDCQGMQNARQHSRADARSDRKSPCPLCLNVYFTKSGTYYHLLPDCIGMMNAELRTLEDAYSMNKKRCPVCLSPETVYATQKGAYFHAFSACSGMEGAKPTDPESAWNSGKNPCPVCITGDPEGVLPANRADSAATLRVPEHEYLLVQAFGKGTNDLIPGYHFDHEAVYQDPELGNGRIWKLKSDTNPNEEAIPGCWFLDKAGEYDTYRLLVNLSTGTTGHRRNNADTFMDGAMCTLYGNSYPLENLEEYVDIHSYVAEQTGASNVDTKLELACVMVTFGWDDEVSGYDALWLYDGKEYYTVRSGFTSDGGIVGEIIEGNALI